MGIGFGKLYQKYNYERIHVKERSQDTFCSDNLKLVTVIIIVPPKIKFTLGLLLCGRAHTIQRKGSGVASKLADMCKSRESIQRGDLP